MWSEGHLVRNLFSLLDEEAAAGSTVGVVPTNPIG
jgi:hypothetical protein